MPISERKNKQTAELSPVSRPETRAQKNGRWSGYSHLLVARLKELKREPEVIFWVFVFPLLLALGLGIAFRNKPADASPVVIVEGPGAQHTLDLLQQSPQRAAVQVGCWTRLALCRIFVWANLTWSSNPMAMGVCNTATTRHGRRVCWRVRWLTISCRKPRDERAHFRLPLWCRASQDRAI